MRTERFLRFCIVGLFLFILLNSCENKPDLIGADLLPSGDAIRVSFDSLGIIKSYTVFGDSMRSDYKSIYILGSQVDPYFGFSRAEIITQIQHSSSSGSFGSNPVVDSVILSLNIKDIIGVPAAPTVVEVYEYTELISSDSSYWSNMDITGKYREQIIGSASFPATDTVIKIRITDDVFINKFLQAEDSVLGNTTYLQEYINGLYITTEEVLSGGIFMTLDLGATLHHLMFYYSNDSISSNDSTSAFSQDYLIGVSSTEINIFQHDYSGYPIEPYINNGSLNDSLLFVQSMAGVSSIIRLEGITDWRDSMPVAIIDAKLILPVSDSNFTLQKGLYLPSALSLYLIEDRYSYNYDYMLHGPGAGGAYDPLTNSYIFNLKVQIQSIIQGDVENLEMILKPSEGEEIVSRTVLQSWSQNPGKRVRLEIVYARL